MTMDELKSKLVSLGVKEPDVEKLIKEGLSSEEDFRNLSSDQLLSVIECGLFVAKRVIAAFNPPPAPVAEAPAPAAPVSDVVPEGVAPSTAQINGFAAQYGMDPNLTSMIFMSSMAAGTGLDFDIGSMVPISQIAGSYSPKIRNMPYLFMGQIQKSLGDIPIVVINSNGSVNADLTAKYVMSIQEGLDVAEDDIYYDDDGNPYQLIKVGVDAQSIYDADPLNSAKALQKNGMGTGRINWNRAALDVRQMVYLAVNETGEVNPKDEAQVSRLRDKIKDGVNRMKLQGDMPKAYTLFNEKTRTGALPTLRVQLSSTAARRPEIMPRRRARPEGGQPGTGSSFRDDA